MKTAISLPDDVFERVSRRARDLGMSRSEFFARAASRYLHELDTRSVTAQINAALVGADGGADGGSDGEDESTQYAVEMGRRTLDQESEDW